MANLTANADKYSFILSELQSQGRVLDETHKKVELVHERLFIRRNGNPSLEAQVDNNSIAIRRLNEKYNLAGRKWWDIVKLLLAPFIAALVALLLYNM